MTLTTDATAMTTTITMIMIMTKATANKELEDVMSVLHCFGECDEYEHDWMHDCFNHGHDH